MCKALYTKHTLNWFPRFSLLVCPAGRNKPECNTADRVSRVFARYVYFKYMLCISQLWGVCPPYQSRGWGICKFCSALGPGIYQPRDYSQDFGTPAVSYQNITTQRILLEKQTYWLICQGKEEIEEGCKGMFSILCMHFFNVYQARIAWRNRELSRRELTFFSREV